MQLEDGMHASPGREVPRLLEKLLRELLRSEAQAIEYPAREARRIGDAPPVLALQQVSSHALAMRTRLLDVLQGNEVPFHRGTLGTTLATIATLRHLMIDRVVDPERSFRTALLELRHGLDVVKLLRAVTRSAELFGVIRWCDDWLGARRTLVAGVEAQLAWFAEQRASASGLVTIPATTPIASIDDRASEDDCEAQAPATDAEVRPGAPRGWHTDRNT